MPYNGVFELTELSSGRYRFFVEDGSGSRWAAETLTIAEVSERRTITLPIVEVEGAVYLGDDPLTADVWIGGKTGKQSFHFESDERGLFSGYIDPAALRRVDVRSDEADLQRSLDHPEVSKIDGRTRLEIRIPDTEITGWVLNAAGQRSPGAEVRLRQQNEAMVGTTDTNGEFSFRGIEPGATEAQAFEGRRKSRVESFEVTKHGPQDLELRIRRTRSLRGTVITESGARVYGARIMAYPAQDPPFRNVVIVSDPRGRFELEVPEDTQKVYLSVAAPGFAFRPVEIPVNEAASFGVLLEQRGGTLVLEGLQAAELVMLRHAGAPQHLRLMEQWANSHGQSRTEDRLSIPEVAPGPWTACRVDSETWLAFFFGIEPNGACVRGEVPPLGELVLALPAPHHKEENP